MNKEFESIIKAIKSIKLKEDEKSIMLANLLEEVPPSYEENQNATNSTTSRLYYYYQSIKNNYFLINKNKFVPIFAMVLIVVLTGGTSAFAEKAVPGDLLYKIKVSINEPVTGIFSSLSKEEETEWKERLVERRLEEAQKLISKNNFKKTTRIELENQIKGQIDEFTINVNELALEKNKSTNSSDINIRLQASLSAHENILKKLSEKETMSTDTKQETKKLLASLDKYKDKVNSDHESLELNMGVESNPKIASTSKIEDDKDTSSDSEMTSKTTSGYTSLTTSISATASADSTSTLAKQNAAENLLNSTKLSYQKEKINLSTNIQNQIDNKLILSETALKEGKTFITSYDYIKATEKFQLVISGINEAKLLMLSNLKKGDIEYSMGIYNDDDIENENSLNLSNELELEFENNN
ncbi:hypothetical protein COW91_01260 [Candidatus Nomurabacteria bacterium CG22_combo_CG10-13_8_21_14_all_32_8]|uniref:DUF5667 domain-containing protein n=1 Tax=Candidatus Nomurabacteria bacterium CG22_combo_CG10-13_8_21_14_all_32_8 TaxID=1974732 RepID=A0A2H0CH66_9BACT|nr:MAG: hypothetical protein COW91_01260 [Candidatus Nomurabacteria bacterium CG22_combo_CG10-13_8_21_14_all_32_8]